ncbi:MAG TPA: DUF3891 family protein [Terriglobales bacterium]|nr:DUF3891 family protein [Terriglobales bacterium]
MILRPIPPAAPAGDAFVPAWEAILRTQQQEAPDYWMIAQPDHAQLAGEIAAALKADWLPPLSAEAIAGIAAHDAGWAAVDERLMREAAGPGHRPVPFLSVAPEDASAVGLGSIERAEQLSPLGGLLVSLHFSRLAQYRLEGFGGLLHDPPHVQQRLREFLQRESQRRARLAPLQPHSPDEIERLTDVLQLCDLISLYVCCGTRESIALPQEFGSVRPRIVASPPSAKLGRKGGAPSACRIEPTALARPLELRVRATRWSDGTEENMAVVTLTLIV